MFQIWTFCRIGTGQIAYRLWIRLIHPQHVRHLYGSHNYILFLPLFYGSYGIELSHP